MPRIGVFTTKGVNMEKEGVMPDVLVEAQPEELAKGIDAQLEKAVEVLTVEVAEWKRAKDDRCGDPSPSPPAAAAGPGPRDGHAAGRAEVESAPSSCCRPPCDRHLH